jgi:hypothetical protein
MPFEAYLVIGYLGAGALVLIYIRMRHDPADEHSLSLLGDLTLAGSLLHLLFVTLWPVWLLLYLPPRRSAEAKEQRKGPNQPPEPIPLKRDGST